ncbi:hypothetical protein MNBD_DELTA01-775 [hydrothermal vent metagenome]|uniref:Thiamine-binding protein domain-containing protein n=1 Tax=hydrothermal vent metagenome TaxID=652676 RepID=A0A3B0R4Y2_9ZZZZ
MMVEFSIIPIGRDEGISESVARALALVDKSGLDYKITPMGTVVEGSWDEVIGLIKECHTEVLKEAARIVTKITIDDRPSRADGRLAQKIESVEKHLGYELKK